MRIIFLDIDGVLNNRRWWESGDAKDYKQFDPQNIAALNHLIESTKAVIVISSAWRRAYKLNWLKKHLKRQGVKGHILGVTPSPPPMDSEVRGDMIESWLKTYRAEYEKVGREPLVFVILDDDDDMKPHMERLVQTDHNVGLTMEDAAKAIKMLKGVTW